MARELLCGAAEGRCEALVEWLVHQPRCLEGPSTGCLYTDAAVRGDRATLVSLRQLGVPWGLGDSLVGAVRRGCAMPALRWLLGQGVPVGSVEEMEQVVAMQIGGGTNAARWLRGLARAAAAAAPGEA